MSFVSEIGEAIENLWPLLEDHDTAIGNLDISVDFERNEISILARLSEDDACVDAWGTGGSEYITASIPWSESIDTLMAQFADRIREHAAAKNTLAVAVRSEVAESVSTAERYESTAKALRALAPSPLEELAQQAE